MSEYNFSEVKFVPICPLQAVARRRRRKIDLTQIGMDRLTAPKTNWHVEANHHQIVTSARAFPAPLPDYVNPDNPILVDVEYTEPERLPENHIGDMQEFLRPPEVDFDHVWSTDPVVLGRHEEMMMNMPLILASASEYWSDMVSFSAPLRRMYPADDDMLDSVTIVRGEEEKGVERFVPPDWDSLRTAGSDALMVIYAAASRVSKPAKDEWGKVIGTILYSRDPTSAKAVSPYDKLYQAAIADARINRKSSEEVAAMSWLPANVPKIKQVRILAIGKERSAEDVDVEEKVEDLPAVLASIVNDLRLTANGVWSDLSSKIGRIADEHLNQINEDFAFERLNGARVLYNIETGDFSPEDLEDIDDWVQFLVAGCQVQTGDKGAKSIFAMTRYVTRKTGALVGLGECIIAPNGHVGFWFCDPEDTEHFYDTDPNLGWCFVISAVINFLKSGHHATAANSVSLIKRLGNALSINMDSGRIDDYMTFGLYHGTHVGSIRAMIVACFLMANTDQMSSAIVMRLNQPGPMNVGFYLLNEVVHQLKVAGFWDAVGETASYNDFVGAYSEYSINMHYYTPYAAYLYGSRLERPPEIVERLSRMWDYADGYVTSMPDSSISRGASFANKAGQGAGNQIIAPMLVAGYISSIRSVGRSLGSAYMKRSFSSMGPLNTSS